MVTVKNQRGSIKFTYEQIDAAAKTLLLSKKGVGVNSLPSLKREWRNLCSPLIEKDLMEVRDALEDEKDILVSSSKLRKKVLNENRWLNELSSLGLQRRKERWLMRKGAKAVEKRNGNGNGVVQEKTGKPESSMIKRIVGPIDVTKLADPAKARVVIQLIEPKAYKEKVAPKVGKQTVSGSALTFGRFLVESGDLHFNVKVERVPGPRVC